jgi:anti-sigma regulatory factor (Ser/Thr protein kinase)
VTKSNLLSRKWTSCPSELSDIRMNITDVCQQLAYSEQQTSAIVLAIDEACTNIIRYAYKDCRDGAIHIDVLSDGQQVIFRLHDFAKQVPKDCIKVKPSSILKPGGLGVMLMQQVMDSVEFIHTKNCKGNILEMKKNLPKESN